jgi:uncharacterized membrane protein
MEPMASSAPQVRAVDAGRGLAWWTEAWPLFTRAALMWIVLLLALMVICVVVGLIPVLGGLAVSLATPVFGGSLMLAARKVDGGGALEFGDLFAGFRDKLSPLLVLGALLLAVSIGVGVIATVFGLGAVFAVIAGGVAERPGAVLAALGAGMVTLLAVLALLVPVAMAFWFAPALVALRDVPPVEALKASFRACLRNLLPMLVYGVIYIAAAAVASIPFGLGWIVLLPLLVLTIYTSYRDIYEK